MDNLLNFFFVLNVAELVDGDEVVSGLGDFVELNGEVLLGDFLLSLLELEDALGLSGHPRSKHP